MTIKNSILTIIAIFLAASLTISCNRVSSDYPDPLPQSDTVRLQSPSNIWFDRVSENILKICWRCDTTAVSHYSIWNGEQLLGTSESMEYVMMSGLTTGTIYNIGIKAEPRDALHLSSEAAAATYNAIAKSRIPSLSVEAQDGSQNFISLTYRVRNASDYGDARCGVCWCAEGLTPTIDDPHLAGPEIPEAGAILQVLPSIAFKYGRTYSLRTYVQSEFGVVYGELRSAALGQEPQAIKFEWEPVQTNGLPDSIKVYTTTSKLSGRNFRAWYAQAPLKDSGIEFRTNVPANVQTIDTQSASFYGDCYIMVNGGYFADGYHTGIAINDYTVNGRINNARGSIEASDKENQQVYATTRGIFGVDDQGNAAGWWATGTLPEYYDMPVTSVKGEEKYPLSVSSFFTDHRVNWLPRAAISAGPLLLKNGMTLFDFTNTPNGSGYYYTNYEQIADDIFGPNVTCDRTAIGCTADGHMIIFTCDGRITSSPGAKLTELALIMKGLGCVDALNLDGGGSTGMMVGDVHLGDQSDGNRKVMSTVGFFRRK